ncbi:hypothetical protein BGX26_007004 [Mortierella sp. AD094]|nr:hypothetical protein BGX26_007004 [Mortierella sp. AD094]
MYSMLLPADSEADSEDHETTLLRLDQERAQLRESRTQIRRQICIQKLIDFYTKTGKLAELYEKELEVMQQLDFNHKMKWAILDNMLDQRIQQIQAIQEEMDALLKIDVDIHLLKEHLAMIRGEELKREGPKIIEEITKLETKKFTRSGEVEKLRQEKSAIWAIRQRISKARLDNYTKYTDEMEANWAEKDEFAKVIDEMKANWAEIDEFANWAEKDEYAEKINTVEDIRRATRSGTKGAELTPTAPKKRYIELSAVEITSERRRRRRQ